jgi:hypothetical protein
MAKTSRNIADILQYIARAICFHMLAQGYAQIFRKVNKLHLPAVYVLGQRDVLTAFKGYEPVCAVVTMWIHGTTIGIASRCFWNLKRVSRVLVWHGTSAVASTPPACAALLGAFVRKIGAYEADLADLIRDFAMHGIDVTHRVGDGAFKGCDALKEVELPHSINYIGNSAFESCIMLTSVTLPDSLTHIGEKAFYGCARLVSVTLPDTLTHIGDAAFYGCKRLTMETLPLSLVSVGRGAFKGGVHLSHQAARVLLVNGWCRSSFSLFWED